MARRRRAVTRKTAGVSAAAREKALHAEASRHHTQRLFDRSYKSRGGKTAKSEGKAHARRHRDAANKAHRRTGARKQRHPLSQLLNFKVDPLKWLSLKR